MGKKKEQLGMNPGTAANRLRKMVLFKAVQELGWDECFQCGKTIEDIDNLSVEHKVPWLDSDDPVGTFFDLDNVAFSHTVCNYNARRVRHGERKPRVKLSRDDVREMRKRYSEGNTSHRKLANDFGVSKSTVTRILNRRRWNHI